MDWSQAKNEFLRLPFSKQTRNAYLKWLERLEEFASPKNPEEISDSELQEFFRRLRTRFSPSSVAQAHCAVSKFYNEIFHREIPHKETAQKTPVILSPEEELHRKKTGTIDLKSN